MSVGTAVRDALDRAAGERTAYLTITQLTDRLGGKKPTAEALGVTVRSVERYLKAERGEGGQVRHAGRSKKHAQRLFEVREKVGRRETAKQIRENGLTVVHIVAEVRDPSAGVRKRNKYGVEIDEEDEELAEALSAMAAAYAEEDDDELEAAFERAFFGAWGGVNMPAGSDGFGLVGEPEIDFAIPGR